LREFLFQLRVPVDLYIIVCSPRKLLGYYRPPVTDIKTVIELEERQRNSRETYATKQLENKEVHDYNNIHLLPMAA